MNTINTTKATRDAIKALFKIKALPPKGHFHIVRVDGSQEFHCYKPTIEKVHQLLGIEAMCCTVTIAHDVVMILSDSGAIDGSPVNTKAGNIARICIPGYPHRLHGPVAIVRDSDMGEGEEV